MRQRGEAVVDSGVAVDFMVEEFAAVASVAASGPQAFAVAASALLEFVLAGFAPLVWVHAWTWDDPVVQILGNPAGPTSVAQGVRA
jgi:hypothetical protein